MEITHKNSEEAGFFIAEEDGKRMGYLSYEWANPTKFAIQLHENANGRDDSPVETEVAEAKSYSAERTFSKDYTDPKDIDRALFNVACIVAHRIHFTTDNTLSHDLHILLICSR